MPDDSLIVPVALVSGSLHFASIASDGSVQDVIDTLVRTEEVRKDILGDLGEQGWALQQIRKEPTGRTWDEEELEGRGNGIIQPSTQVSPFLSESRHGPIELERHFSVFPLTSHLHTPALRLVSLHPNLSLCVSFLRVPEIHDGFNWEIYFSRSATVEDVINSTVEELGLTKVLPVKGSGALEYVLEEILLDDTSERSSRLHPSRPLSDHIQSGLPNRVGFRFCVPDEWYRRTRHTLSSVFIESPESTIKQLATLEESNVDRTTRDGRGTAKQNGSPYPSTDVNGLAATSNESDWRGSLSQSRLSNFFDSLLYPSSTPSPTRADTIFSPERKSVSEPMLVEHSETVLGGVGDDDINAQSEVESEEYERMLDELGLRGLPRTQMYQLPPERRRYLLQQSKQVQSSSPSEPSSSKPFTTHRIQPSYSTYGPSNAGALLPRLVPQLTGDNGLMRRFSITGWGAKSPAPVVVSAGNSLPSDEFDRGDSSSTEEKTKAHVSKASDELQALQPQSTGGLWNGWWTSSGGDRKGQNTDTAKSAKWYVDGLQNIKVTDNKLVKHLISLRVHLSTAPLVWIDDFLKEQNGVNALETLLARLVGKGGKGRQPNELETTILLELTKCLRVLLNTESGFDRVLASPTVITHIAYSLYLSSLKLRTLASELLAAICVLSIPEGHRLVLAALSDYRIAFDEAFRFESLINFLRLHENTGAEEFAGENDLRVEADGIWEARTATMALFNAIVNCPESLEERTMLREEFGRRGLNEVIVTLRYTGPPDSLVTQLDVYTEEKFDDEEDARERAQTLMKQNVSPHERARSESETVMEDLIRLARQHGELYPMMIEVLKRYGLILQRDIGVQLKADLFTILDKFVEQAALLDDIDDSWHVFLKRFAMSVKHITQQDVVVRAVSDDRSMVIIEQELESLRAKVEELSDERAELRNELSQQIAEMNTLKSLPLNLPMPHAKIQTKGQDNFHGLVQRLVQKEKQVLQLQAELDRTNGQTPSEERDADARAKRERDRVKWNTLMDEIAKLKMKNGELEPEIEIKQKEIIYLKRALESVYSRFRTKEGRDTEIDPEQIARQAIESLQGKEDEITTLRSTIADLQVQLAAKPKFVTEKEFKAQFAPPPPPPPPPPTTPKPRRIPTNVSSTVANTFEVPLPPPPPPPPSTTLVIFHNPLPQSPPLPNLPLHGIEATPTDNTTPPSPPPPPPPPPPPLPPLQVTRPSHVILPSSLPLPAQEPPPPPPPPSAFRMGPNVKVTRPVRRLKPFFWNKLAAHSITATVWNEVATELKFEMDDLEATFTIDNASSTSQILMSPTKKQNVTTMLDITRANNVAIMLSRIKLGFPEIRRAVLDIDDERLSVDDLRAISKQLPTLEEITRIRAFEDTGKLAKADQYFSQIMTIPRLAERLECMFYRRKLELDIEEIRPDLDILHNASRELRSSTKFKRVLQAVLSIGNALNGLSYRGGARGFQLEALLKMKETKTAKGGADCPTLLHYLARVLLRNDPSLVMFIEEIPHVEAAARVSVQTIVQSVNALVSGLSQVKEEVKLLRQAGTLSADDRFLNMMQPFIMQVTPSVDALKNMGSSLDAEIHSLLVYYGETPDSPEAPKPEDFFGLILSFSSSLQKCALELHDAEERNRGPSLRVEELTEEPLAALTLKARDEMSKGSLMPPPADSQGRATAKLSVGRGDLDQAIRSLRDGKRRTRPTRPLSKIFLDGGRPQNRAFD